MVNQVKNRGVKSDEINAAFGDQLLTQLLTQEPIQKRKVDVSLRANWYRNNRNVLITLRDKQWTAGAIAKALQPAIPGATAHEVAYWWSDRCVNPQKRGPNKKKAAAAVEQTVETPTEPQADVQMEQAA
jgi:hypothetical protein